MRAAFCWLFFLLTVTEFINGKRFRRSMEERNLVEAIHAARDTKSLQCTLDTSEQCEKELYVRDLQDDLKAMKGVLEKLGKIDWSSGNHITVWATMEKDEWEVLSLWYKLHNLLPKTYDESTGEYKAFGHFIEECLAGYHNYNFSSETDCGAARKKAKGMVLACELRGLDMAINTMDFSKIDFTSATSVQTTLTKTTQILAEVRDLQYFGLGVSFVDCTDKPDTFNDVFKTKAGKPETIKMAVEKLMALYGKDEDGDDEFDDKEYNDKQKPKGKHYIERLFNTEKEMGGELEIRDILQSILRTRKYKE